MLSDIIISHGEVEKITGLDISRTQISGVYRFSPFSSLSNLITVAVNESIWLGIVAIFSIPVVAIALTRYAEFGSNYILVIGSCISIAVCSCRWVYLHFKKQELKRVIALLEQIDKHNQVGQSLQMIQKVSELKKSVICLQHSSHIIESLNANRESLVCALMMDAIVRNNKLSLLQQHEMLATVESNFEFIRDLSDSASVDLSFQSQIDEYTNLINEVLTINLKVTQEMRNINLPGITHSSFKNQ